jgi:HD superfamily phosphodiesterase
VLNLLQSGTYARGATESDLLFHHSSRVYYFGALAGLRQGLKFDSELLYIGAMFHDMGLTKKYSSPL